MKAVSFFTPEHAVARFRAARAADANGTPRVRIKPIGPIRPIPLIRRISALFQSAIRNPQSPLP